MREAAKLKDKKESTSKPEVKNVSFQPAIYQIFYPHI